MINIAINAVGDELEKVSSYCQENNIGIEITDFAFPAKIDINFEENIIRHRKAVCNCNLVLSHGPFLDLIATSLDPKIVEVTNDRHEKALDASHRIGAKYYIAHTNFNPLIRNNGYIKSFVQKSLDFWLPKAEKYGKLGMTICLENLWEASPELQIELISKGNHPFLKASFDNGHALVFSNIAGAEWVSSLGKLLGHCHLHDNSKNYDEHHSIGEGKENWELLFNSLKNLKSDCVIVAESDRYSENIKSLEKINTLLKYC